MYQGTKMRQFMKMTPKKKKKKKKKNKKVKKLRGIYINLINKGLRSET